VIISTPICSYNLPLHVIVHEIFRSLTCTKWTILQLKQSQGCLTYLFLNYVVHSCTVKGTEFTIVPGVSPEWWFSTGSASGLRFYFGHEVVTQYNFKNSSLCKMSSASVAIGWTPECYTVKEKKNGKKMEWHFI